MMLNYIGAAMNDDDAAQLQNNLDALWNGTQGGLLVKVLLINANTKILATSES